MSEMTLEQRIKALVITVPYTGSKKSDAGWNQPFLIDLNVSLDWPDLHKICGGNSIHMWPIEKELEKISNIHPTSQHQIRFIPLISLEPNGFHDSYVLSNRQWNTRGFKQNSYMTGKSDRCPFVLRGTDIAPFYLYVYKSFGPNESISGGHVAAINYSDDISSGQSKFIRDMFMDKLTAELTWNHIELLKYLWKKMIIGELAKKMAKYIININQLEIKLDEITTNLEKSFNGINY